MMNRNKHRDKKRHKIIEVLMHNCHKATKTQNVDAAICPTTLGALVAKRVKK